jgi:hypothetical protein
MRIRTLIPAALAALTLAACGTTSATDGRPGPSDIPTAPETDRVQLPPEACAALAAEPLPPEGVSESAVFAGLVNALGEEKALELWRWWRVDWPLWARDLFSRLEAVGRACDGQGVAGDSRAASPLSGN